MQQAGMVRQESNMRREQRALDLEKRGSEAQAADRPKEIVIATEWLFLFFACSTLALGSSSTLFGAYAAWDYNANYIGKYYVGFILVSIIGGIFSAGTIYALFIFFGHAPISKGFLRYFQMAAIIAQAANWIISLVMMLVLWSMAYGILTMVWASVNILIGCCVLFRNNRTIVFAANWDTVESQRKVISSGKKVLAPPKKAKKAEMIDLGVSQKDDGPRDYNHDIEGGSPRIERFDN